MFTNLNVTTARIAAKAIGAVGLQKGKSMRKVMMHKIAFVVAAIAVGSAGVSADALARGGGGGGGGGGHMGGGGGEHMGGSGFGGGSAMFMPHGGFGGGHFGGGGFGGGHMGAGFGRQQFAASDHFGDGHRGREFGGDRRFFRHGHIRVFGDNGYCGPYGYYRSWDPYYCW